MNKETILQKTNEELNKLVALNKALERSYDKALEFINEFNDNDLPASVDKLIMAHASIRVAVKALRNYNARVEGFSFTQEFFIRYYGMQDIKLLQYFVEYVDTLEDC